jgi:hypothetical protein
MSIWTDTIFYFVQVVYLFRIDAHGPAEKLLALSISHPPHIGLQRYQVVEKLGIFESEMARAVWKLNQMAEATLNPSFCSPEDQNNNQKTSSSQASSQSHQSLGMDEHLQDHPIPAEQTLLKTVPRADTTISASHWRISRPESDCQLLPGQPQCSNHADWHSKITKPPDLEKDEMMTNDFGFEEGQKVLHPSSGGQRKISLNETNTLHGTQKGEMNPVQSENIDLNFQGKEPNAMSGSYAQELGPFAPDPNAWLPGETIDGGMEWLQTLFANDLDTHLPFPRPSGCRIPRKER